MFGVLYKYCKVRYTQTYSYFTAFSIIIDESSIFTLNFGHLKDLKLYMYLILTKNKPNVPYTNIFIIYVRILVFHTG